MKQEDYLSTRRQNYDEEYTKGNLQANILVNREKLQPLDRFEYLRNMITSDNRSDIGPKYFPILDLAFLYCVIQRQPIGLFYVLDQDLQNGTLHFWTEVFNP